MAKTGPKKLEKSSEVVELEAEKGHPVLSNNLPTNNKNDLQRYKNENSHLIERTVINKSDTLSLFLDTALIHTKKNADCVVFHEICAEYNVALTLFSTYFSKLKGDNPILKDKLSLVKNQLFVNLLGMSKKGTINAQLGMFLMKEIYNLGKEKEKKAAASTSSKTEQTFKSQSCSEVSETVNGKTTVKKVCTES